jgi:hypothetical protein
VVNSRSGRFTPRVRSPAIGVVMKTNSKKQCPSREAYSHSTGQGIPRLLLYPKLEMVTYELYISHIDIVEISNIKSGIYKFMITIFFFFFFFFFFFIS